MMLKLLQTDPSNNKYNDKENNYEDTDDTGDTSSDHDSQ